MKRILLTTIISSIGVMVLFSIYATIVDRDLNTFVYLLILGTGNIIIPTFATVCVYRLLALAINLKTEWKNLLTRMLLLGLTMFIGLWIWAIIDVYEFHGSYKAITVERVIEDFNSEFYGWLRIAFMLMIAIPLVDRIIKRKIERRTFANRVDGR
jgi:hypothetical protein